MTLRNKFRFTIYCCVFVLPILIMMSCSGWNSGTMEVQQCIIDVSIIRLVAKFYSSWLMLSSFMLFIPVVLYVGGCVLITELSLAILRVKKT